MIYLFDRGFRIKSSLNILVNQCKYPGIYNECFCLGCNVNQGMDSVLGMPTCFADDNDNASDNDNDNDKDKDNDIDNDNDNDNDLRSSFANQGTCSADNDKDKDNDKDNFIYLFSEKHGKAWLKSHQKVKHNNNKPTNSISITEPASQININDDLQSWLNDDDIITEATFPDNFRCIISGPSECGKTFILKKLILASIYFNKLYIIGPTGDQYIGLERINPKAIIEFIKDIKDLPSPDKLRKDLKKLMIFDDVRAKKPVINKYFCRGRHKNFNMIYLNQNLFSLDRQSVRENCNLFIFFEQREKVLASIYQDFFY